MDLPDLARSAPKLFADRTAVRARGARLHEPHIGELTQLVERIRMARGGGNSVPWFDPDTGGRHADVLLLFEAPGARAVGPAPVRPNRPGSSFISPENNDDSAAAVFELEREASLPRDRLLHWNIVPWYVEGGTKIRAVNKADRAEAEPWLTELLDLLTNVRVAILCGEAAQDGWDPGPRPAGLWVLRCPHPSRVNLRTRPDAREEILDAFTEAAWIVDPPTCPTCGALGVLIVYGTPGPDLVDAAERGEVLIGGCVITGDDPTPNGCAAGHEWKARRSRDAPRPSAPRARPPVRTPRSTTPGVTLPYTRMPSSSGSSRRRRRRRSVASGTLPPSTIPRGGTACGPRSLLTSKPRGGGNESGRRGVLRSSCSTAVAEVTANEDRPRGLREDEAEHRQPCA